MKIDKKIKIIEENSGHYALYKISFKLDILNFLETLHKEDNHRGINSLRNYVSEKGYYVEGITFLSNYILKSCVICFAKSSRFKLKREPPKKIITNYL